MFIWFLNVKKLIDKSNMTSFFGSNWEGSDDSGHLHHFSTLKLLGRALGPLEKRAFLPSEF